MSKSTNRFPQNSSSSRPKTRSWRTWKRIIILSWLLWRISFKSNANWLNNWTTTRIPSALCSQCNKCSSKINTCKQRKICWARRTRKAWSSWRSCSNNMTISWSKTWRWRKQHNSLHETMVEQWFKFRRWPSKIWNWSRTMTSKTSWRRHLSSWIRSRRTIATVRLSLSKWSSK